MTTSMIFAEIIILVLMLVVLRLLYIKKKLTVQIRNNEVLQQLAFVDALTGVYNRNAYNKHITDVEKGRQTKARSIILFDIDNFKRINDTQGHLAGDMVLKLVAKKLVEVFSSAGNTVYRIGGDEFAVISEKMSESEIIDALITLRLTLKNEGDIRVSNGYSMIKGNVNSAFKYADKMLYIDKFAEKH